MSPRHLFDWCRHDSLPPTDYPPGKSLWNTLVVLLRLGRLLFSDTAAISHLQSLPSLLHTVAILLRSAQLLHDFVLRLICLLCDITSKKGIERVARIKGIKPENAQFTCICEDMKMVGEYTIHVSTPVFKLIKRATPGPYTFILEASKAVPKLFQSRRKTLGVRLVDHPIVQALVEELGRPIMSTSIHSEDEILEYEADPQAIYDKMSHAVDMILEGGWGGYMPSTVIDCSKGDDEIEIIREGLGPVEILE